MTSNFDYDGIVASLSELGETERKLIADVRARSTRDGYDLSHLDDVELWNNLARLGDGKDGPFDPVFCLWAHLEHDDARRVDFNAQVRVNIESLIVPLRNAAPVKGASLEHLSDAEIVEGVGRWLYDCDVADPILAELLAHVPAEDIPELRRLAERKARR